MKKKLRSILALLMAILMVAACTACGSGGNGGTASGSSKLQGSPRSRLFDRRHRQHQRPVALL